MTLQSLGAITILVLGGLLIFSGSRLAKTARRRQARISTNRLLTLNPAQFFRGIGRKWSKRIIIAVTCALAVITGNIASAQISQPLQPSLKTVPIPKPDNLGDFIQDEQAAIKLGKALFWDMQVGSDGIQSCASCHFHSGADNRSKNQISPGLLQVNANKTPNPDRVFGIGGAANYQLKPEDFPFHKLADPDDRTSTVIADTNDVTSSQGVFNSEFIDVVPGSAEDQVSYSPDPDGFQVVGTNVRRVEPRNTPTVINAVFNERNFWDGRAQSEFNGVNSLGQRDPNATLFKATVPGTPEEVRVSLNHSSLASLSVEPPLSSFEMSADGRTFQEIGDKFGLEDKKVHSAAKGKKLPRKLGKKILTLGPLGKQLVHPEDSVLGSDSQSPQPGLKTESYSQLITAAFKPEWWNSPRIIRVNADGSRTVTNKPDRDLTTEEYTLMEYNFPLFFGLSLQEYMSTLVSDNTPFDQFMDGNANALTAQQQRGLELFQGSAACIFCHNGAEFTSASVSNVKANGEINQLGNFVFDNGFFNIGVRPTLEDLALGNDDAFGNALSASKLAQQGKYQDIFGKAPNISVASSNILLVDGAFKTPGLRNVELTAPYFHNGGQLTLEQVVEFYNRGGDDPQGFILPQLNLGDEDKQALVAFMKSLTDERVRYEKAPFDHPQLFVPNGHPGDTTSVTDDGQGNATDALIEIPAVGRNGGGGTPNFLEALAPTASTSLSSSESEDSSPPPPGAGYTQADCPAGTTFIPLDGGYLCQ